MDYSLLGPTGVKVSKICLGTATFGVAPDAQEAERVVHTALDAGINFFDTVNVYGATPTFDRPGVLPAAEREPAEQILGRALAGRRDEVVIATKSGERRFDPAAGLSRRYIIQQVEQSLRRLGTDYIDLYYAHFPDPDTPAGPDPSGLRRPGAAGEAALRRPVQPPGLASDPCDVDR
jgi:aryl-alcohol dehydrogenase-like predicted oxidoreductase